MFNVRCLKQNRCVIEFTYLSGSFFKNQTNEVKAFIILYENLNQNVSAYTL